MFSVESFQARSLRKKKKKTCFSYRIPRQLPELSIDHLFGPNNSVAITLIKRIIIYTRVNIPIRGTHKKENGVTNS